MKLILNSAKSSDMFLIYFILVNQFIVNSFFLFLDGPLILFGPLILRQKHDAVQVAQYLSFPFFKRSLSEGLLLFFEMGVVSSPFDHELPNFLQAACSRFLLRIVDLLQVVNFLTFESFGQLFELKEFCLHFGFAVVQNDVNQMLQIQLLFGVNEPYECSFHTPCLFLERMIIFFEFVEGKFCYFDDIGGNPRHQFGNCIRRSSIVLVFPNYLLLLVLKPMIFFYNLSQVLLIRNSFIISFLDIFA